MSNSVLKTNLVLSGVINDEMANKFIEDTQEIIDIYNNNYLGDTKYIIPSMKPIFPTINVTINSPGGSIYAGNLIITRVQEMEDMGIKLEAKAVTAMSMAFIVFLSFSHRSGNKFTSVMNHSSSSHLMGYREEMRADLEQSDKMDAIYNEIIREKTTIPEEDIKASELKCVYYNYDECVKYNIINTYPGCESEVKEFAKRLSDSFDASVDVFSELSGLSEEDSIDVMYDFLSEIKDQPLEDEDEDYESPEFLDCFEISEDCQGCPDKKECFDVKLESMKCCIESGKCDTCDGKEECLEDRRTMLSMVCNDNTCESCDYVDLCDTVEFDVVKDKDDSECQAPHCSGDCCNCDLCDIEVEEYTKSEEDMEHEEHECDCDGSCDNCTCDKDNTLVIDELDNVPPCYGEVCPQDEECISCEFLNACCVKTKAELESCKDITKQEEGIDCDKCEFKEECKEQLEFCDKVLNITNN